MNVRRTLRICAAVLLVAAAVPRFSWAQVTLTPEEVRTTFGQFLAQGKFDKAREQVNHIRDLGGAPWLGNIEALLADVETATAKLAEKDYAAARTAMQSALKLCGTNEETLAAWRKTFAVSDAALKAGRRDVSCDLLAALYASVSGERVKQRERMHLLQRLPPAELYSEAEALCRKHLGTIANEGEAYVVWYVGVQVVEHLAVVGHKGRGLALLQFLRGNLAGQYYNTSRRMDWIRQLCNLQAEAQLGRELVAAFNDAQAERRVYETAQWALAIHKRRLAEADAAAALTWVESVIVPSTEMQRKRRLELLKMWLFALLPAAKADATVAAGMQNLIDLKVLSGEASFLDIKYRLRALYDVATKADPALAEQADPAQADTRAGLLVELWWGRLNEAADKNHETAVRMQEKAKQAAAEGNATRAAAYEKQAEKFLGYEARLRKLAEGHR